MSSGLGPISIGSDGGGSIRIPASYTATLGFKPSGGRVPVTPPLGVNPSVGPITRTVRDAAEAMNVITQPDDRDFLALPRDGRDYRAALGRSIAGVRIGVLTSMGYGVAPSECVAAAFERPAAASDRVSLGIAAGSERAPPRPFVSEGPRSLLHRHRCQRHRLLRHRPIRRLPRPASSICRSSKKRALHKSAPERSGARRRRRRPRAQRPRRASSRDRRGAPSGIPRGTREQPLLDA